MKTSYSLSMTRYQHELLRSALYPGDDHESVALLLCGERAGKARHRLLVREIYPVLEPWYQNRSEGRVTWSTDALAPLMDIAESDNLTVIKVHSHPSGYAQFSATDDESDSRLLPAIRDWLDHDRPHGSAIMLPNGQLFGRVLTPAGGLEPLRVVSVVGDDLLFWFGDAPGAETGDFFASHRQAFGVGTTETLRQLTVAVVGCSGTGSPVVEQLARLGVGRLILVDDDVVEDRNLNRVLYASTSHAAARTAKVEAVAEGIRSIGLETEVIAINENLGAPKVVEAVAEADVVFGCMDSIEGRYLLNRLATFYTIPYFDIGVRLVADGAAGIDEICGTINYLQPGGSSLISRGLFSMDEVAADGLRRRDPDAYRQQLHEGYIRGAQEQRPAVISVNMFAASLAINEFLARLHPYRDEPNSSHAAVTFSLASMEFYRDDDGEPCSLLRRHVGRGDQLPSLGLLQLSAS